MIQPKIISLLVWVGICLPAWADSPTEITTLAASCAACHGPQGNSLGTTPTLAALNQHYFVERMHAFKTGTTQSTVMHHHAKGLTDAEITALAAYFSSQPRRNPPALPTTTFQGAQ